MNKMEISAGQAGEQCLKSAKCCSFQCCLQAKDEEKFQDNKPTLKSLLTARLSRCDVMPAQHAQQLEQHAPHLQEPHGFLTNEETVFFNTNISTEEFNASIASYVPHATISISWSALVRKDEVQRVASGLHFIKLYNLYETGCCPTANDTLFRRRLSSDEPHNTREFQLPADAGGYEAASEPLADNDMADFWEPNEHYVGQRCLLEDDSFVLSARA